MSPALVSTIPTAAGLLVCGLFAVLATLAWRREHGRRLAAEATQARLRKAIEGLNLERLERVDHLALIAEVHRRCQTSCVLCHWKEPPREYPVPVMFHSSGHRNLMLQMLAHAAKELGRLEDGTPDAGGTPSEGEHP